MTRINVGISVKALTDEHLLAEHREIKRLPDSYLKSLQSGSYKRIPNKFCLGTGHVLFFIDKSLFTLNRYKQIHGECLLRKFNVEDYSNNWNIIKDSFKNDYEFTSYDRELLLDRITERIKNSKQKVFHYYGKVISKDEAIELLYLY